MPMPPTTLCTREVAPPAQDSASAADRSSDLPVFAHVENRVAGCSYLRPFCSLAGIDNCIKLLGRHDVAYAEGIGMVELKVAEDWPVREASPRPRSRPWCRRAQTRPTAACRPLSPSYSRPPLYRCCGRCLPAWKPQRRSRGSLVAAALRRLGCCDAACNPAGRRSPERPDLVLRCSGWLAPPRQGPGQLSSRWAASWGHR